MVMGRGMVAFANFRAVWLRVTRSHEAMAGIGEYIKLYNSERPHLSLEGETPDVAYFQQMPELRPAA